METDRPRKYLSDLKRKLLAEGSEVSEKIGHLKMKSADGKMYATDVADRPGGREAEMSPRRGSELCERPVYQGARPGYAEPRRQIIPRIIPSALH